MKRGVDHLVIGGGPAGAMAAILLAQAGKRVVLVEKERSAHDKVCGEFLSREAVSYLLGVGISPRDLGAAAIRLLRLSCGEKTTQSALPFPALSLSRRVLDATLLERAAKQGCEVLRGCGVERLFAEGNGWEARLSSGPSLRAQTVFLATGKHDLHGWGRGSGRQSDLVGFKTHWQLPAARVDELRESMELFLFDGGYGGLSLIENEVANFCFVVRRSVLRAMGGYGELFVQLLRGNERLRRYLGDGEALWPKPLAVSPIPYGYLAREKRALWCVGDQAAVIPSFTGDGISIALHSAALAAQMFLEGRSAAEYGCALRAQLGGGMRLATWLSRAMVTRAGRALGVPVLSAVPRAMHWVAVSTRIPEQALLA